jgi:hypothetical protein
MAGAAILPGGTQVNRPGSPGNGWLRHNTDQVNQTAYPGDFLEYYDVSTGTWQQLITWAQADGISIDVFSTSVPGVIATDVPVDPGYIVGASVTVPAGYESFYVTSSLSWESAWDTTAGVPTSLQQGLWNVNTSTRIGYNAVQFGTFANLEQTKIGSAASGTFSGSSTISYTFEQRLNKSAPVGPPLTADYNLAVLAWRPV